MTPCVVGFFSLVILSFPVFDCEFLHEEKSESNILFLPRILNPIPPGLFEGGSAWEGGGGEDARGP